MELKNISLNIALIGFEKELKKKKRHDRILINFYKKFNQKK